MTPLLVNGTEMTPVPDSGDSLRDYAEHGIARGDLIELLQRRVAADFEVRAGAWSPLQIGLEDRRARRHRHFLQPHLFRSSIAERGGARAGSHVTHPVGILA